MSLNCYRLGPIVCASNSSTLRFVLKPVLICQALHSCQNQNMMITVSSNSIFSVDLTELQKESEPGNFVPRKFSALPENFK